jgi:hypothetical protein
MASLLLNKIETAKLKLVCETIIERAVQEDDRGRNIHYRCEYCNEYSINSSHTVEHSDDCPYVAAKYLMEEIG